MINICIIISSNFVDQAMIFLNSLFSNNKKSSFNIYIVYSRLNQEELEYLCNFISHHNSKGIGIYVDRNKIELEQYKLTESSSDEVYYKIFFPELLPKDIDKVLYCDVDEIVNKPIMELYNTDIKNKKIAVVSDYFVNKFYKKHKAKIDIEDRDYFNAGVMLINLKQIRQESSKEEIKKLVNKYKNNCIFFEQDLFNILYTEADIYKLNEEYNYIAKIRSLSDYINYKKKKEELPTILHYAGIKPLDPLYDGKYYDEYWKYATEVLGEGRYEDNQKERKKSFIMISLRRIYRFIFHVKKF